MFCPSCGSMMRPADGKYVCIGCGAEKEIGEKVEKFTTSTEEKETTVVKEEVVTLPKTRILCPKCSNREAYFTIRQTRSADEPSTTFYRCCKCNYSWREY